jgi:hypothetical protein
MKKCKDLKGIMAKYYVVTLEGTGAVPGRGGEHRKDQTHNTAQPIGVRTGFKVALLANHRMFRY